MTLTKPALRHAGQFLEAVRRSRSLHRGLVTPPATPEAYRAYLNSLRSARCAGFLILAGAAGDASTVGDTGSPSSVGDMGGPRRVDDTSGPRTIGDTGGLAGIVNLNEIVRGGFQSAYLGYYAFEPYAGHGWIRRGLGEVIGLAFGKLKLHRLEANIQPENPRSIALVQGLGFRLEGFSPRYLKVCGRWRDHERWALLADEWRQRTLD